MNNLALDSDIACHTEILMAKYFSICMLGTVSKLFSKTVILNTRNKLKLEKLS